MTALTEVIRESEVFLNPGDFHFHIPAVGRPQPARLRTLLGSCVSVILWHPTRRLAGMSHAILPERGKQGNEASDGRYCDESIKLFCQEITRAGAQPQQFHAYLVGGGQMYATAKGNLAVGDRNIEAARTCLIQAGFKLRAEHVGKGGYRKVQLEMKSGEVTVTFANKRINLMAAVN